MLLSSHPGQTDDFCRAVDAGELPSDAPDGASRCRDEHDVALAHRGDLFQRDIGGQSSCAQDSEVVLWPGEVGVDRNDGLSRENSVTAPTCEVGDDRAHRQ